MTNMYQNIIFRTKKIFMFATTDAGTGLRLNGV
jgi:hypothetical protein